MENKSKKKVYCKDCSHYRFIEALVAAAESCNGTNDTHFAPNSSQKNPAELNKNNDCKLFKRKTKWYLFWKNERR